MTKLINGFLTVTFLKEPAMSFSKFCMDILSGFTDYYFEPEYLFVEREKNSDRNAAGSVLQSL